MNRLAIGSLAAGFLIALIGVLLLSGLSGLPNGAAPNLIGMASVLGGATVVIYGIDQLVKEEKDSDSD